MKLIDQLSYRSNSSWRPQATVISEDSIGLWGVCFSWGELDLSAKVLENVRFFVEACLNQSEITNPFGYQESLTGLENALRSGCALANDVIFRLVNKVSLTAGAECVLIAQRGREIALVQIGQPHVFLKRNNQIVPLLTAFDFLPAANITGGAFIPNRLLGVNSTCYPHLRSFHYEPGDELILLAHSFTPGAIYTDKLSAPTELKDLFQKIAKEAPQCPFWLSKIRL